MLHISRWNAIAIVVSTLIICLLAVPNVIAERVVQSWPKWAQRQIVLGLDLQGGSHILLEVDVAAVRKEKVAQLAGDVRRVLRDARIQLVAPPAVKGNSVEVRIRETDLTQGLAKLRELSQPLGGVLGTTGARSLDIVNLGGGLV